MSEKRKAVDFPKLLERMEKDQNPADGWPTIAGGKCAEGDLLEWLKELDLIEMDVRIWEFTDHCTIGADGPPNEVERLERARLFGEGGDLDIRRSRGKFLWRFVGKKDYAPKGKPLELPRSGIDPVYRRERTALLWGTRKGRQEQWFDDRVSGAPLTYFSDPPSLPEKVKGRVQVRYYEYTQAGRTLSAWLRGLEAYDG